MDRRVGCAQRHDDHLDRERELAHDDVGTQAAGPAGNEQLHHDELPPAAGGVASVAARMRARSAW
jgi:hypothetical protein